MGYADGKVVQATFFCYNIHQVKRIEDEHINKRRADRIAEKQINKHRVNQIAGKYINKHRVNQIAGEYINKHRVNQIADEYIKTIDNIREKVILHNAQQRRTEKWTEY